MVIKMVAHDEDSRSVREEITFGAQQFRIVSAIASWCEALHGSASLKSAFSDLCIGLGAQAGILVRTRRALGQVNRIAIHDPKAEQSCGRPLRFSLSESVFGTDLDGARAGTIWHEADACHSDDPLLKEFQAARGFREFCVLVLASGPVNRDHIELHFHEPISPRVHATLAAVVPTMARTWATRQIGVVAREAAHQRRDPASDEAAQILGAANPARLSRAEYRVCLLLSRGLSAQGVAEELGISDPTVRSHLRNIYAKTQTGNLAELLFRLIGTQKNANPGSLRYA